MHVHGSEIVCIHLSVLLSDLPYFISVVWIPANTPSLRSSSRCLLISYHWLAKVNFFAPVLLSYLILFLQRGVEKKGFMFRCCKEGIVESTEQGLDGWECKFSCSVPGYFFNNVVYFKNPQMFVMKFPFDLFFFFLLWTYFPVKITALTMSFFSFFLPYWKYILSN